MLVKTSSVGLVSTKFTLQDKAGNLRLTTERQPYNLLCRGLCVQPRTTQILSITLNYLSLSDLCSV